MAEEKKLQNLVEAVISAAVAVVFKVKAESYGSCRVRKFMQDMRTE